MSEHAITDGWNLNPDHISINMENFQFVWLDPKLESSTSPLNVKYYRKKIIELNTATQFFTDFNKCLNFIKTVKKEKLFLILSGTIAAKVLKEIYLYKPLTAVFIFTRNEDRYRYLLINDKKIVGIYNSKNHLLASIRQRMNEIKNQLITPTFFDTTYQQSFRDLSKEEAAFFWYQLLFLVLKDLPYNEGDTMQFLEKCEKYYRNNSAEWNRIKQFPRTYHPDRAIEWYTRDTFLYRIVSKAFRDDNIYLIYSCRFFIIDLYNNLVNEKNNMEQNQNILTLYRGTRVPKANIEDYTSNIGRLILMKGFFSTSRDKEVALVFAGQLDPAFCTADEKGLLFEISTDPRKNILFADIAAWSTKPHEQEVLFGPNAIFHIDSIELDSTPDYATIKMTATDDFSNHFQRYLNLQQEEMRYYEPLIYFGRFLFTKMSEIQQARVYFEILETNLPPNDSNLPLIYCQMGDIYLSQKSHGKALDYYHKAIRIYYDESEPNILKIIDCLLKIGNLYLDQKKIDEAGIIGRQVETMLNKVSEPQSSIKGMMSQMIGKVHLLRSKALREQGKLNLIPREIYESGKYLLQAYELFKARQRQERTNFISILGDLSDWYEAKGIHLRARQLLRKQVRMAHKYLSFDDQKQHIYVKNFIELFKNHGLRNVAIKFARRKVKFYEKKFGKTHPIVINILSAMGYHVTVCHILFDIEPTDEHAIVYCLNELAQDQESSIKNIKLFQKWFTYLSQNYPANERRIGDALRQLANIYNDMDKPSTAYYYLSLSLKIYRYHHDHLNMRTIEDFMKHIQDKLKRLHIANIVCDDNWENGILCLAQRFEETPILNAPSQYKVPNQNHISLEEQLK